MVDRENKIQTIKAVILVGSRDFGRCPLASRLNRALWPVFGKPAIERVLDKLAAQGIERIVVSCESQMDVIRDSIHVPEGVTVDFRHEPLPRGPAGCIFDAACDQDEFFLVFPGGITCPPNVSELLSGHIEKKSDMTVFLNPQQGQVTDPQESGIYMCNRSVLDCIPKAGYFDLKEGLVPALVHAGKTIAASHITHCPGNFRNWRQYLFSLKRCMTTSSLQEEIGTSYRQKSDGIWIGENVFIHESAKLIGPLVIGDDSIIGEDVIVVGPSVIGADVTVGAASVIEESILWDHVAVGRQTRIRSSLVDYKKTVLSGHDSYHQLEVLRPDSIGQIANEIRNFHIHSIEKPARLEKMKRPYTLGEMISGIKGRWLLGLSGLLVTLALILSYWNPILLRLWNEWSQSDEYSSGLLVPIVSLYVIWLRRKQFLTSTISPCIWGLVGLVGAQCFRYFGLYYMFESAERISFILSIGALVLFIFGWKLFKKFIPIFLFLFLMLPLPGRVESLITIPLQKWATVSAVFCLEMLGFSVIRQGNVIDINGTLVAVAEACNGLRMLTAFVVVSGMVVLVTHRKWWEKPIILISSVPIALICNTLRLTITAYAFTILNTETWERRFHDFGGFAMMPIALLLIVFELWLLSQIVIEPKKEDVQIIYRKKI